MKKHLNRFYLLVFIGLNSCSYVKKEFPIYEISKPGQPSSYLSLYSNYITTKEANDWVGSTTLDAFNQSNTYFSFFDLNHSNYGSTKEVLQLDSKGSSIADIYPDSILHLLDTSFLRLQQIKTKPIFFVMDQLQKKDSSFFNFDLFWQKNAMVKGKQIKGLISYQDYYGLFTKISFHNLQKKLKTQPLHSFLDSIFISNRNYLILAYSKTVKTCFPTDIIFTNKKEKQNFYSTLYGLWLSNIEENLANASCFIPLDMEYLAGEYTFQDYLLTKGYQIKQIN